jgi:ferrochelatase
VVARLSLDQDDPWKSYVAMRYTPPTTHEAVHRIREDGVERLVVVPLYPQFSWVTTGSSLKELARVFAEVRWMPREVLVIRDYHDDVGYLEALAATVNRALEKLSPDELAEAAVLFSAHALPLRVVRRGDPYPGQVVRTVRELALRLSHPMDWRLAWQSQVRPFVRWLEPRTDETIRELARKGKRTILIVPVSFLQEHVETLYEMAVLYAHVACEEGVRRFVRVPTLGEDSAFLDALAGIVRGATRRDRCMSSL